MPTWLIILLIITAIGAVLGFIFSDKGERGYGALQGGCSGAMGCGYILLQLFILGLAIYFVIWLWGVIFD